MGVEVSERGLPDRLLIIGGLALVGEKLSDLVLGQFPITVAHAEVRTSVDTPGRHVARLLAGVHLRDVDPDDAGSFERLDGDLAPHRGCHGVRRHACRSIPDGIGVERRHRREVLVLTQSEENDASLPVTEGTQGLLKGFRHSSRRRFDLHLRGLGSATTEIGDDRVCFAHGTPPLVLSFTCHSLIVPE